MKKIYAVFIFLMALLSNSFSQPTVGFQSVATGFSVPVDMANAGDSRLFIVEQSGKIKIWDGSSILSTPFLDVASATSFTYGGEQGLLSLAFHPNYATNRYFFIYYNNGAGNVTVARYQTKAALPNEADPASGVVLMSIPKPFTNHNGGKLNFGSDGYLYFATGDGGSGGDPNNYAQTGTSYLGKMLRIDVNNFSTPPYYSIPPTNPYLSDPNINDEIIALGLRNPYRWSFDRQTGDMWIADVGQEAWEEVNFKAAGTTMNLNYGWRCFEGTHVYNNTCSAQPNNVVPIFDYSHNFTTGGFSITGGYVYRGADYPFFQGYYIFADYLSKNFWLAKNNGSGFTITKSATQTPANFSGFGESSNGTLYALGHDNGTLYKVTATAPVPLKLISFTGKKTNGLHQLYWTVQTQVKGERFIVERSFDNATFIEVGSQTATADKNIEQHSLSIAATNNASTFYRLKMLGKDGSQSYSPTINIKQGDAANDIKAVKNGSMIYVSSSSIIKGIQVLDVSGRMLQNRNINSTGVFGLDGSPLPKGMLILKIIQDSGNTVIKLVN